MSIVKSILSTVYYDNIIEIIIGLLEIPLKTIKINYEKCLFSVKEFPYYSKFLLTVNHYSDLSKSRLRYCITLPTNDDRKKNYNSGTLQPFHRFISNK